MKVTDIVWDTDGEDINLPTEMHIPDELLNEGEDQITNYLSDQTGWCVESWGSIVRDDKPAQKNNGPWCVVETNTLNSNVTVHLCKTYDDAASLLKEIRDEYIASETDYDTDSIFHLLQNCCIEDTPTRFDLLTTSSEDYHVIVQIVKAQAV